MPVICTKNIKEHKMYSSEKYTIEDITDKHVIINSVSFKMKEFQSWFTLGFCVTVYKYQGGTIDEPYNIFDVEAMNKKQLYTSLSRTTTFDYIHLDNTKLKSKYVYNMSTKHLTKTIKQSKYKDGKIYQIDFDDGCVYIGSTIKSIEERFDEHLNDNKSVVFKNKDKNPIISLKCNYPCYKKDELERCEMYYINKCDTDKLLNKRMNDTRKKKKKYSFKCTIMNENELMKKIDIKLKIKDKVEHKFFVIDYKLNNKHETIRKRYNERNKEEVRSKMIAEQTRRKNEFTLHFD
jgi:hypothetical protein